MKVEVFIERGNKKVDLELEEGATVADAIKKSGALPTEVIATKNGSVVTDATSLADKDQVKLLSVISGG